VKLPSARVRGKSEKWAKSYVNVPRAKSIIEIVPWRSLNRQIKVFPDASFFLISSKLSFKPVLYYLGAFLWGF
jgi:hypothetical protein